MYALILLQLRQQQNEFAKYYERHKHLFAVDDQGKTLLGVEGVPICLELPLHKPEQMTALNMLFDIQREAIAEAQAHLKQQAEALRRSGSDDLDDDDIFKEGD